ncbi:MAG: hypothetical protein GX594_15550 [Pirellulaceae bacterium]|nr:hypothetical protein [Pirellulaceae bacterium]
MNTKTSILRGALCGLLAWIAVAAQAGEDSVAKLVGKLQSADKSARLQALDALGQHGEAAAEAVAPLKEMLQDASGDVRARAAHALGAIGPAAKPAVAALIELLKDPDEMVRRQAVKAVLRISPGPRVAIPLCVKLLEDADAGVRVRGLHAIAEAGAEAVPGLIQALKNDNAAYWACLVLREIGPPAKDAVPALTKLLGDSRPEIRREAILALASMEESAAPAAAQIAAALDDELTCHAATYALGRIGRIPPGIEPAIRANINGNDKLLSIASLWTLARVHPENKQHYRTAVAQFVEGLKDADPLVRTAAAHALATLPPAPEITIPLIEAGLRDADETTVRHALDALATMGPAAVPSLIEALKHEKTRGHVIYIIGRIGADAAPAVPALTKLVADKDEHVALEAAVALAQIGPAAKDAVPALIEALHKSENSTSHAFAYALGMIGPDAAAAKPALSDLLKNSDRKLALVSAWALVRIGPATEVAELTLPVLTAGLASDSPLARRGAAEALGRLGPAAAAALDDLDKATNDRDRDVRRAAEEAVKVIRGS